MSKNETHQISGVITDALLIRKFHNSGKFCQIKRDDIVWSTAHDIKQYNKV